MKEENLALDKLPHSIISLIMNMIESLEDLFNFSRVNRYLYRIYKKTLSWNLRLKDDLGKLPELPILNKNQFVQLKSM